MASFAQDQGSNFDSSYDAFNRSYSRKSSVSSRRIHRRKSSLGHQLGHELISGERVYDVPSPTISQQRRRSRVPAAERRPSLFNENDPTANQKLTDAQLYGVLQEHNSVNTIKNGTIRLPSDVLYRRKSRFDETLFDAEVLPHHSKLNATTIAMDVSRRREEEEDPIRKTYKGLHTLYRDNTLLRTTLNRIQGRYGAAIMEYFSFVKWLVVINITISLLTLPLILPQLLLDPAQLNLNDTGEPIKTNLSCYEMAAEQCTTEYTIVVDNSNEHSLDQFYLYLLDFIQGTGHFEKTLLFYGYYNKVKVEQSVYPMDIMFLCSPFLVFIFSLICILYRISRHHEDSVLAVSDSTATQNFSIAVLAGWDHGLAGRSPTKIKKRLLKQEFQQLIADEEYKRMATSRTRFQKYTLWSMRLLVNLIVLATWFGCGAAIFYVSLFVEDQKTTEYIEYLPTVVITAIYLVVPTAFSLIVRLERYRPTVELGVTMARILFLRLASLFFLFITTFNSLTSFNMNNNETSSCEENIKCTNANPNGNIPLALNYCWETYMGQQIYRLIILDFAVLLATTYLLEYPRQAIYKRFERSKLMRRLGQQEFDMPKNVMDVLYNQILCWIGFFFAPLIPALITVKMVLFFIIKKGSLFQNQRPSATLSKSSALSSFFYLVMWISLVLAYLVLVVYLQFVPPSQSCGPFRVHLDKEYNMFDALTSVLPKNVKDVLDVLENRLLQVAIILLLLVMWYLNATVSNGLTGEIKLHVGQLRKSVMDKTFLLKKVNAAIQQTNAEVSNIRLNGSKMPAIHRELSTERVHGADMDQTSSASNSTELQGAYGGGRASVHRDSVREALKQSAHGLVKAELTDGAYANISDRPVKHPVGKQLSVEDEYPFSTRHRDTKSHRRVSRQFSDEYLDSSSSEDSDDHYKYIPPSQHAPAATQNYMNMFISQPENPQAAQPHFFGRDANFLAFRQLSRDDEHERKEQKRKEALNRAIARQKAAVETREESDSDDYSYEGPSQDRRKSMRSKKRKLMLDRNARQPLHMHSKMANDEERNERQHIMREGEFTSKLHLRRASATNMSADKDYRRVGNGAPIVPKQEQRESMNSKDYIDFSKEMNVQHSAKVSNDQRVVKPGRRRGPYEYDNDSFMPEPDYNA